MPELSRLFIRTALFYLISGSILGGLLLFNKAYPINYHVWMLLPIHYHTLFFGWILQFVFGVAFWIMPRFASSNGKTWLAWNSYILLNSGLLTLVFSYSLNFFSLELKFLYILAIFLIYSGIVSFILHMWPRVKLVIAVIQPQPENIS